MRAPAGPPPDSARAIRAAARALDCVGGRCFPGIPRRVIEFARDSAGVVVSLVAANPATVGGGGTVRVFRGGRTKVLAVIR